MTRVNVYSTPECHWCKKAKDFLKAHKIAFENFDVSRDTKAAEKMIKKSGQYGVPVVEVGKEIIVGFNEVELKKALKIK